MKRAHTFVAAALLLGCAASTPAPQPAETQNSAAQPNVRTIVAEAAEPHAELRSLFSAPVALLPEPVTSFGAASMGKNLYLLGGFSGEPHSYSKEGQHGELWQHSAATGQWIRLPGATHLQSVTLTAHRGDLVRVGGMRALNNEDEDENLQSLTEVARFNPQTRLWTTLSPLPAPRSSHDTVSAGDSIFVVGGWRLFGAKEDNEWHTTMLECKPTANGDCDWKQSGVPFVKRALAAAHVNGTIYALGGMNENGVQSSMYAYNIKAQSWSEAAPYPGSAFGIAATSISGQLVASGNDGALYKYDAQADTWTEVGHLTSPRMFHQMVPSKTGAVVVGGISGLSHKRTAHIEQVSADARTAGVVWSIPTTGAAKNRQGMILHGDSLSLFGGNNSLGQHDFAKENFVSEGVRLNLASLTWEKLEAFPSQRQSMTPVFVDRKRAVLVGGFGFSGTKLTTLGEAFTYDIKTEKWTEHGNAMPEPRTQFGFARHGQDVWIFGGLSFDSERKGMERFEHPTAVLRANLNQDKLEFVASGVKLQRARRAFSSGRVGDEMFLFGGMADGFKRVDNCEAFSFKTKAWRDVACPRAVRIGAEMVEQGGLLYLIAGKSPGSNGKLALDSSIEVYDPKADTWSVLTEETPLDTVDHARAFSWRGRLLLFSSQREAPVAQIALLDPAALANGARVWTRLGSTQPPGLAKLGAAR